MEFQFNINELFDQDITLIDSRLRPCTHGTGYDYRDLQRQLSSVIDKMGDASAKAQGLHGPITGGHRLTISDHHLFVMKDADANSGKGTVVGILKTGYKKLFIYDHNGGHHEMEPLCVLDFYVHESKQRQGCGKRLFEHMLKEEGIKPQHLAVDRPSPKFLSFLSKHYHLKGSIPQVNNFVVFESFFRDRPSERRAVTGRPPLHPYKRQNSNLLVDGIPSIRCHKAESRCPPVQQTSTHSTYSRLQREKEALSDIRPASRENITSATERPSSASRNLYSSNDLRLHEQSMSRGMSAQQNMYSRHTRDPTPPPPAPEGNTVPEVAALTRIPNNTVRGSPPILRRRDGPSKDYMQLLHGSNPNDYQDRRGHLKVSPLATEALAMETKNSPQKYVKNGFGGSRSIKGYGPMLSNGNQSSNSDLPPGNPYSTTSAKPQTLNTAWNIFGVQQREFSAGARKYQHTKLW